MNRILIASAFALGLSGAALAQEAPYYVGNYSASVSQELNNVTTVSPASTVAEFASSDGMDTMTTASFADTTTQVDVAQPALSNVSINDQYSGR